MKGVLMDYYHYQCAGCGVTLYMDALPQGASYTYVTNGQLCSACIAEDEQEDYDNYSYDDD